MGGCLWQARNFFLFIDIKQHTTNTTNMQSQRVIQVEQKQTERTMTINVFNAFGVSLLLSSIASIVMLGVLISRPYSSTPNTPNIQVHSPDITHHLSVSSSGTGINNVTLLPYLRGIETEMTNVANYLKGHEIAGTTFTPKVFAGNVLASVPSSHRKLGLEACSYSAGFYNLVVQNMCARKINVGINQAIGGEIDAKSSIDRASIVSCVGTIDSIRGIACVSANAGDLFDGGETCRTQPYCLYGTSELSFKPYVTDDNDYCGPWVYTPNCTKKCADLPTPPIQGCSGNDEYSA